jgi:hypothetical protein
LTDVSEGGMIYLDSMVPAQWPAKKDGRDSKRPFCWINVTKNTADDKGGGDKGVDR